MVEAYHPGLTIFVTEYNAYYTEPEELQVQAVNLLFLTDTLGQLIVQGFDAANHWDIINGLTANGGDYGYLLVNDGYRRQPSYYAFPLWTRFGDRLLASENSANATTRFSAYAGLDANDNLTLLAVNKTGEPIPATLVLDRYHPIGSGSAYVARADALDAYTVTFNGLANPPLDLDSVPPLPITGVTTTFVYTFPAYSVTALMLEGSSCATADLDCDGDVDLDDIRFAANCWSARWGDDRYLAICDLDHDEDVDIVDVQLVAAHWESGRETPRQAPGI
ncbi:MAG TPA: hypothetical protein EYH31_05300 [Anaerolineae bacterium]|nr:hypothetical protein [Anaerolineae bacterium]